ncbi:MAG: hypothetical protein HGB11_13760 [Chlorobiales bacterium]|nr:hypothetical protein [Chlorobiales bacterium]
MKKLAVFLLCLMVISGIGLYLASGMILAKVTDKVFDYLSSNVETQNLEYSRPVFASVELSNLNAVTWKDISLNVTLMRNEAKTTEEIALNIGAMTISLESLTNPTILISADGISAETNEKGDRDNLTKAASRMEDGQLQMLFSLRSFSKAEILEQLGILKEEMRQFSVLGVTKVPIYFSATEIFEMQGQPSVANFTVVQEGEEYRLIMDKNDLQKIVALLAEPKPNPVEVEVIARNPLKASGLLKIRDKAAATAELAAQNNSDIPEDAYRHTLWSYLLTKKYGEQFAKEVTDAHEAYADQEEMLKASDFNAASYQDLVNNALGRQYALMKLPESEILERVMTDSAIIKDNEVVNRFDIQKYQKLKTTINKNNS